MRSNSKQSHENKNSNISSRKKITVVGASHNAPISRNKITLNTSLSTGANFNIKKSPPKKWTGDQLLLPELEKLYKKEPTMDRLEL